MPLDIGEISDLTPKIFKKHLKTCAEDGEEFDIYQNCGFVGVEGGCEYLNAQIRAIICFCTQIISLAFLTGEAIRNTDKRVCEVETWSFSMARVAVIFYAAYLGSNFRNFMYTINWKVLLHNSAKTLQKAFVIMQGCYPMLFYRKKVSWMNANWIAFGYFVNVLVVMLTAICTIAIMYVSTSVIDIVLNGFALFFIHELDDYMMSLGDYGSIKWDYLGGYWDEDYQGMFQGDHPENEKLPFDFVDCDLFWVCKMCRILEKATNIIMYLAPVFLAVCY